MTGTIGISALCPLHCDSPEILLLIMSQNKTKQHAFITYCYCQQLLSQALLKVFAALLYNGFLARPAVILNTTGYYCPCFLFLHIVREVQHYYVDYSQHYYLLLSDYMQLAIHTTHA